MSPAAEAVLREAVSRAEVLLGEACGAHALAVAYIVVEQRQLVPRATAYRWLGLSYGHPVTEKRLRKAGVAEAQVTALDAALAHLTPTPEAQRAAWTEADEQTMAALVKAELCPREIAAAMGLDEKFVRNKARTRGWRFAPQPRLRGVRRKAKPRQPALGPRLVRLPPGGKFRRPFLERGNDDCAWPVSGEGMHMIVCGKPIAEGQGRVRFSYCEAHLQRLFRRPGRSL